MSETPKTDAASFWARDMGEDSASPHELCVDAEFARELERESARLKEELTEARNHEYAGEYLLATKEVEKLKAELADQMVKNAVATGAGKTLADWREKEKEERDRFRNALATLLKANLSSDTGGIWDAMNTAKAVLEERK